MKKNERENKIISQESFNQSLQSYLGVLKHCKGYKAERKLLVLGNADDFLQSMDKRLWKL